MAANTLESAEFAALKAEPNLEKRARKALEFSLASIDRVLEAYQSGNPQAVEDILAKMLEAVELAHESLVATGKAARRRPKHFKRAEIQTRRLLNQIDNLSRNLHFDERAALGPVRRRVSEINGQILEAIMSKPRKK